MKGSVYNSRKTRLLAITLVLTVIFFFSFHQTRWARQFAESKVSQFIGHRFKVKIGSISGGVFRDMVLRDVVLFTGIGNKNSFFPVDRLEISYRVWDAVKEKFKFISGKIRPARYIAVYFSEENPFVRGFVKLYKYPGKIEIIGHISLALFEEEEKKGIKGVLFKREDGRYNCNMVLDGKLKIEGIVDFSNKAMELDFVPVSDDRWLVKIKGGMESNGSISIYSRIDKIKAGDVELIGDIWISYLSGNVSEFSMKTENFLVNRKPFWDIMVNGKFSRFDNKITIDRVKWGDNITLTGDLFTKTPCPMDLRILIKGLELAEIAKMLSVKKDELTGRLEGDIGITGSRNKATVKGRVYIGEGTLGEMKFRSLFATLKGNLPVISIVDSRVVKDWGNILVSGEIDFSKLRGGKAFDDLLFETDNKVAVWENWQIAKEETLNIVEASKDRMTVITSLEDDDLTEGFRLKDSQQKELGFKYKLDTGNSIKLEFEEDRDFFGVEHKIQF